MYFEDRTVAFVDILGFKSLVGTAVTDENSFGELKGLVELLSTAVPNLDKTVRSDETYMKYEKLAKNRLAEPLGDSVRKKWEWFHEFLKSEAPEGRKWAQA